MDNNKIAYYLRRIVTCFKYSQNKEYSFVTLTKDYKDLISFNKVNSTISAQQ